MKHIALSLSLLLMSVAAMSQTYSDANLNGKYVFRIGTPAYYTWFKTFACPTNTSVTYTATAATTTTQVNTGVLTADGAGNWTGTNNLIGKQNTTASNNTMSVTWSSTCQVTKVNSGHVVYQAASSSTISGKYSITSSGTGTLTITGQTSTLTIQLAATNSAGISTVALLTSAQVNGQTIAEGTATLE